MLTNRKSYLSLAGVAALVLPAIGAHATIRYVPSQYSRLQWAINAAAPGDTIIVAAGTYNDYNYYPPTVWNNKDLTIQGAGPGKTFLFSNGEERCLSTQGLTSKSSISGFTFSNGAQAGGAGMLNTSSNLTVSNCEFSYNQSAGGGGMFNQSCSPIVINCSFHNNTAMLTGGGMMNQQASPTVIGCTFNANICGESGGGMENYISSNPTVTNCIFTNQQALDGGGMDNTTSCNPKVADCVFYNNQAFNLGGGMHNYISSSPQVLNCTFTANSALKNFGNGYGGAISDDNTAGATGSIAVVTNCILWGDTAQAGSPEISGAATVTYSDEQGLTNTSPDAFGNFGSNPLFVNAAAENFNLQAGSPCISRGDVAVVTNPPFLEVTGGILIDLAGCRRVYSGTVGLGAYEFQPLTDVTSQVFVAPILIIPGSIPGSFIEVVEVVNNGATNLAGPISLIVDNLSSPTILTDRTGITSAIKPANRPYINLPGGLAAGAAVQVTLNFSFGISATFQTVAGTGTR